ncbi:hypothetical protein B0H21DRAFT_659502, partial [Amylocystis lapponica]
ALLLADEASFTNCLVVMRPKTTRDDLPSRTTLRTKIMNNHVDYFKAIHNAVQ